MRLDSREDVKREDFQSDDPSRVGGNHRGGGELVAAGVEEGSSHRRRKDEVDDRDRSVVRHVDQNIVDEIHVQLDDGEAGPKNFRLQKKKRNRKDVRNSLSTGGRERKDSPLEPGPRTRR